MIKTRIAIALAIIVIAGWLSIESDIEQACGDNQACLAASL